MTKRVYQILFALVLCLPSRPAEGAATHTAEAVQYLYKAVHAYEDEDFGAAKINLQLVLEREPNFAEAYLLKGLLQHHDGKDEEANASFEQALKLNPRLPDKMREHLEKQAHDVEAHLTEQEFAHFRLQFHGGEQRNQAWDAVKYLDEVYNEMGSRFGIFPEGKIPVIIFTSEQFWEAWNAPFWLGGFFDKHDGKIRVRMEEPPGGDEEFHRRLRHEFSHAFLYRLYPKELPIWFHEGMAQFYAYASPTNGFWKDVRLEELRKLMKGAPWLDMKQIEQVISKKNVEPGYIYLAYLEAEALILYTAKERGDSWLPSFVERLRRGMSFEAAFQDVVGLIPADMLARLHHSLE